MDRSPAKRRAPQVLPSAKVRSAETKPRESALAVVYGRFCRSGKARGVKAITEELSGHSFSAAAISTINVKLDESMAEVAGRRPDEACPYLILDAPYERVREAGVIRSQAMLLAIGINWDGRRSVLVVELANRESRSS